MLAQHSNRASNDGKSVSTSASMPSLGTSRPPRLVLGSSGRGEGGGGGVPDGGHDSSSRDQAVAKYGAGKKHAPAAPEEDFYTSSTQTAYLSGETQLQSLPICMWKEKAGCVLRQGYSTFWGARLFSE